MISRARSTAARHIDRAAGGATPRTARAGNGAASSNGAGALPARQGARRDHRRRQLRLGVRAGRALLPRRRPRRARARADARRPRRLPRARHRVHGRLRHRLDEGRQGPRPGDLGRAEQHDQVRQGARKKPRRARAPRHDPRRPRQVPQGEDHEGARRDRRHRAASSATRTPTSSSPTCRSAPSRRPSGTSSRCSRRAAGSSTASPCSSRARTTGTSASKAARCRSSATTSSRRSARRSCTARSRACSPTAA